MRASRRKWLIPLVLLPLFWMELSQAFCFSFGTGNNRRADYYNRPLPVPWFPPGSYPFYPFSPVEHGWYGPPVFGMPFLPGGYRNGYVPLKQD